MAAIMNLEKLKTAAKKSGDYLRPDLANESLNHLGKRSAKAAKTEAKAEREVYVEALKNCGESIRHATTPEERTEALKSNERLANAFSESSDRRLTQTNRFLWGIAGGVVLLAGGVVAGRYLSK